jgi:hypothetical protein
MRDGDELYGEFDNDESVCDRLRDLATGEGRF